MVSRLLLVLVLLAVPAAPAAAKAYRADRFDVRIEVLRGGSLRITETIVFHFTEGTFSSVFRTVPTRRTDGVEFLHASMDGRVLPRGTEAGQVEVGRRNGLRVEWHFAPVSGRSHTFELAYLAHGVVRLDGPNSDDELLVWRALPNEHAYPITSSTVHVALPAAPRGDVQLDTRRVDGEAGAAVQDGSVVINASHIRRNGWIQPQIRFARGDVLDAAPAWQRRRMAHGEMAPTWLALSGGILLVGFVLLTMMRQGYDAPPRETGAGWSSLIPPDAVAPAIAGALVTNGRPGLEHAMGALLGLADRGAITVTETTRGAFNQRGFVITASGAATAPHEEALLETIFDGGDRQAGVPLAKAQSRLMGRWKTFKQAVLGEMRDMGLLDAARAAHRGRYNTLGIVLLVLGVAAIVPVLIARDRFGAWPMVVPLGIAAVALAAFIFAAAETPLSNEGVRRAEAWRGYQKHLRDPQGIEPRWGGTATAEWRILPYAVALGLGGVWSRFVKKRGTRPPSWFEAASSVDSGPAFAAFIATGAGPHGSVSGTAGVAGGGSSGAR